MLLAQAQQVQRQPLLGRAGGQPFHFVDVLVHRRPHQVQHPHAQVRIAQAHVLKRLSGQAQQDGISLAARIHGVAPVGHEHGSECHQVTVPKDTEHTLLAIGAVAKNLHLPTQHQEVVLSHGSLAKQFLSVLQGHALRVGGQLLQVCLRDICEQGGLPQPLAGGWVCRIRIDICHWEPS